GINPRTLTIEGHDHPKVMSYLDVLRDHKPVGKKVAIVGAGGIGFDVAEFLVEHENLAKDKEKWLAHWGIDKDYSAPGALKEKAIEPSEREVYLLQRKTSKVGKGLGKTTGWIHRQSLKHHNVQMMNGVSYEKVDDEGLHVLINDTPKVLPVDNVIVCAGQEPFKPLQQPLEEAGFTVHIIGGADVAAELDAKRAIRQGAELAARI
ncbi:MAG: FAD-dependent oxidoreductase, partial [Alteromonas macleodii]|nr:FAD-dependent oxidoreductase [Alteromonas macleodii]